MRFVLPLALTLALFAPGCVVIQDPQPEDCDVETVVVERIEEGPSHDVVLHKANGGSRYVNRGLEDGPDLATWRARLEGERVTLHVVRRSDHVARITKADGTIAFDEFGEGPRSY